MSADTYADFSDYLTRKNHLSVDAALTPSDPQNNESYLHRLWKLTDLSVDDFADEVAHFYKFPRVHLSVLMAASTCMQQFTRRFLRETMIFPYVSAEGDTKLAVTDPRDEAAIRAAEIVLGRKLAIEIASFDDVTTVLTNRLGDSDAAPDALAGPLTQAAEDDIESLRDLASGAPVVRAVNDLLERAMELGASDIHIEPFRSGLTIRMRIDGLLRVVPTPPNVPAQAVISRIKILAGLNIAERRLPQDGAARLRAARSDIDVRVATMPTPHGESAVLRLLSKDRGVLEVGNLGLGTGDETRISRLLALPHGMIVVTGPTGSGKTTTLATMLAILNEPTRKILTIEDPIEYEIAGINQSQVKPSIGLTFAAALRAFVRQDPDVIMVGEVRDAETAHIAIHAALTGHLVLTTLHTETAAASVPRLLDLGIESFLLKSTLRAVVAQRLVRILCDRCKIERKLTDSDLAADPRYAALGLRSGEYVYEPGRCERCSHTGYRGRRGVFEVLEMSPGVRDLVGPHTDSMTIEQAAIGAGMTTMIDDAIAKCRAGITSVAEVLRVTMVR